MLENWSDGMWYCEASCCNRQNKIIFHNYAKQLYCKTKNIFSLNLNPILLYCTFKSKLLNGLLFLFKLVLKKLLRYHQPISIIHKIHSNKQNWPWGCCGIFYFITKSNLDIIDNIIDINRKISLFILIVIKCLNSDIIIICLFFVCFLCFIGHVYVPFLMVSILAEFQCLLRPIVCTSSSLSSQSSSLSSIMTVYCHQHKNVTEEILKNMMIVNH